MRWGLSRHDLPLGLHGINRAPRQDRRFPFHLMENTILEPVYKNEPFLVCAVGSQSG